MLTPSLGRLVLQTNVHSALLASKKIANKNKTLIFGRFDEICSKCDL